jgi:hypothetical protein
MDLVEVSYARIAYVTNPIMNTYSLHSSGRTESGTFFDGSGYANHLRWDRARLFKQDEVRPGSTLHGVVFAFLRRLPHHGRRPFAEVADGRWLQGGEASLPPRNEKA